MIVASRRQTASSRLAATPRLSLSAKEDARDIVFEPTHLLIVVDLLHFHAPSAEISIFEASVQMPLKIDGRDVTMGLTVLGMITDRRLSLDPALHEASRARLIELGVLERDATSQAETDAAMWLLRVRRSEAIAVICAAMMR